jgi:hypothetical protein
MLKNINDFLRRFLRHYFRRFCALWYNCLSLRQMQQQDIRQTEEQITIYHRHTEADLSAEGSLFKQNTLDPSLTFGMTILGDVVLQVKELQKRELFRSEFPAYILLPSAQPEAVRECNVYSQHFILSSFHTYGKDPSLRSG